MIKRICTYGRDLFELLYPVTCLVCGDRVQKETHICSYCLDYAFEPANPEGKESCEGMILPEWIVMQDALWKFDKGGFLQDVLHHMKYSGLAGLGLALGRRLGYHLKNNKWMDLQNNLILLPVPLYISRQRKRGYNQAALLARGVSEVLGAGLADETAVVRIKNTRTQTGLNAGMRKKNIDGAFRLQQKESFRNTRVLIIDDVITTGVTTFELAMMVSDLSDSIAIATLARA